MKKKKGFTLIELLVVIAIIAMLLAILMPALGKVKKLAMRLVCGTNLKGMGTAVNVYAFDYDDMYPVQGGRDTQSTGAVWGPETPNWNDPDKDWSGDADVCTVSASLFLLVREADVGTKSFICKSGDEKQFSNETGNDIVELWDFGINPAMTQSYSYQNPFTTYSSFPANGTNKPDNVIMADKNPWLDSNLKAGSGSVTDYIGYVAVISWDESAGAKQWQRQIGNASAHGREGQNVVYNDGHVEFAKRPDVATGNDNIYTAFIGPNNWNEDARRIGEGKTDVSTFKVKSSEDTLLAGDDILGN